MIGTAVVANCGRGSLVGLVGGDAPVGRMAEVVGAGVVDRLAPG